MTGWPGLYENIYENIRSLHNYFSVVLPGLTATRPGCYAKYFPIRCTQGNFYTHPILFSAMNSHSFAHGLSRSIEIFAQNEFAMNESFTVADS